MEPGGSNYLAFYVAPEYLRGCRCPPPYDDRNPLWVTWARTLFLPGAFGHAVGDYHRDPDVVRRQLREMYAAGQRKIGLFLHLLNSVHECLDLSRPAPDVCHTSHAYAGGDATWGFALPLDSTTGQLLPVHQRNLKNLLADIRRIGFNQVNVRFAPFGELELRGWRNGATVPWDAYHSRLLDRYWAAVRSTVDSVNGWVPERDSLAVVYDLSAELATYVRQVDGRPWNARYSFGHVAESARRLWRAYLARYGNTRTVGFTFGNRVLYPKAKGSAREVITVMNRDVYDVVGERPKAYAFDIYPNDPGGWSGLRGCKHPCYDRFFEEIARQIRSDSAPLQVLVWESLYNERVFAEAVRAANQRLGLGIPYVMQWPVREQSWGAHITEVPPTDYDWYLRLSR